MWFKWKSSWVHNQSKTAVSCYINFDRHVHTLQELGGTWFVWAVFMLVVWFEMLLCLWCTNTSMHVHTPVVQTCAAGWRPLLSVMCGNLSTRVLWLVCPLLSEICWMCHWLLYFTSVLPHMIWQAKLENVSLQKHSYREGGIPVGSFSFVRLYGLV